MSLSLKLMLLFPDDAASLVRCLPGEDATNGFFVSCFIRVSDDPTTTAVTTTKRKEMDGEGESNEGSQPKPKKKKRRKVKKTE